MDNDQEVVREPFEDGQIVSTYHRKHDDDDCDDEPNLRRTSHQRDTPYELDEAQLSANGDIDSSSSASGVAQEDVDFGKSFDIHLKASKCTSAYDRLMKSKHFDTNTSSQEPSNIMIKTSVTSDCIYHKGTFYQKGDIVALCDQDDGQLYFAQLTGFLQDQYCEKSASLNWLVPIRPTSREFFDPAAFRIGLEDNQLRKLDCMTFVRHCPHDYYLKKFFQATDSGGTQIANQDRLFTHGSSSKEQAFIWTSMEPCPVPSIETRQSKGN